MKLNIPLVAIILLFFCCCDENEVSPKPSSEYYFTGRVDDQQVLVEEIDSVVFLGGFSDYGITDQGCYGSYKTGLYEISSSGGQTLKIQINFYNVTHAAAPCDETDLNEAFFSGLTIGDYQLSWIKNDITTVGIHYYDSEMNRSWSSIRKDQSSDNSFFTVEKTEFIGVDDTGKKLQKVEGKFSSYLYENDFKTSSIKDSIFVSNAEFVFKFISE